MNHKDPSHITDERARQFVEAYQKEFGEELLPGEAGVLLGQLVQLYLKISQPLPDEAPAESYAASRYGVSANCFFSF